MRRKVSLSLAALPTFPCKLSYPCEKEPTDGFYERQTYLGS